MTTTFLVLSSFFTWVGLGLLVGRFAAEGLDHPIIQFFRRHGGRHAR